MQLKARALTTQQIEKEVKKAGPSVEGYYQDFLNRFETMFHETQENSQEEYAGFLFAHAALSNLIAQKHNIKR